MRLLLALGLLVAVPGLFAQQQPQQPTTTITRITPAPGQVPPSTDPAPLWLGWRTFHAILVDYQQKSPDGLAKLLTGKFGLNPDQATVLLNAGQKYLADTQQIELQTRDEVRRRYIPALSGHPSDAPPAGPQTTLERAKADGLYAQMEGLHQNALDNHLHSLHGKLMDAQIAQLSAYVQATVMPKIKVINVGRVKGTPVAGSRGPAATSQR